MEFYACKHNELMHYGVKGMKWGKILNRPSISDKVNKEKSRQEQALKSDKLSSKEREDVQKSYDALSSITGNSSDEYKEDIYRVSSEFVEKIMDDFNDEEELDERILKTKRAEKVLRGKKFISKFATKYLQQHVNRLEKKKNEISNRKHAPGNNNRFDTIFSTAKVKEEFREKRKKQYAHR